MGQNVVLCTLHRLQSGPLMSLHRPATGRMGKGVQTRKILQGQLHIVRKSGLNVCASPGIPASGPVVTTSRFTAYTDLQCPVNRL